jgi:hypothetical protein
MRPTMEPTTATSPGTRSLRGEISDLQAEPDEVDLQFFLARMSKLQDRHELTGKEAWNARRDFVLDRHGDCHLGT